MSLLKLSRFAPPAAAFSMVVLSPVQAQNTGLDLGYGLWFADSLTAVYSVSVHRTLLGPFDFGIGATHLRGPAGPNQKRVTGGELSLGLARDGSGPYLVAAAGVGMRHSSGDFDTQWSAGGGYGIRPLRPVSLGIEARYRAEDRASRGFWRLNPSDQRGMIFHARVTLGTAAGHATNPRPNNRSSPETYAERSAAAPIRALPEPSEPHEIAALRSAVVETAMEVMGTPYRWGGEGEEGFDCSGLIRYAYGEHGLILPRLGRDQASMGMQVERSATKLAPGDILGFSDGGRGITHVGLYVGDGIFIHSSSSGVKLSSLLSSQGDGPWWQQRWVVARRLIN